MNIGTQVTGNFTKVSQVRVKRYTNKFDFTKRWHVEYKRAGGWFWKTYHRGVGEHSVTDIANKVIADGGFIESKTFYGPVAV